MGKRNNVKVSMEKLIELNKAYVRGTSEKPTMAARRIAMATDPGIAHMI